MELIDTHAHLYEKDFINDHQTVIDQCKETGIVSILMPNINSHTIKPLLTIANTYQDICKPMMGIHPAYIKEDVQKDLYIVESWLRKEKFIAIGEIGLDFYHDTTYQGQQKEAFSIQLEWAKQYNLPVVIHSRAAFRATLDLINQHQDGSLKGVFHCFGGTLEEAEEIIEAGLYLGIGGIITFKNCPLAGVISELDLKHLVLETDSPYLTPVPHRKNRNTPAYLPLIAATIAYNKQISITSVAEITTSNARQLFQLD